MERRKFAYTIEKHLGTISTSGDYSKEVSLVCWKDQRTPRLDIRLRRNFGDESQRQPLKGVSINTEEIGTLKELLNNAF